MLRKIWLALVLSLIVSVGAAGFTSSQATTCRRITVWINGHPYLSDPICFDLPDPVDQQLTRIEQQTPAGELADLVLPRG